MSNMFREILDNDLNESSDKVVINRIAKKNSN